jgi:hypothetical protein
MKFYERPQAHHWVIARLLRANFKDNKTYNVETARSVMWMIRTLGGTQVNEMLDALRFEEESNGAITRRVRGV